VKYNLVGYIIAAYIHNQLRIKLILLREFSLLAFNLPKQRRLQNYHQSSFGTLRLDPVILNIVEVYL
jgi:hypothetical protein